VCMYVQSKLKPGITALVDSAVLVPDDGTSTKSLLPGGEDWVPSADVVDSLRAVQDRIRRGTRLGQPQLFGRERGH